MNFGLQELRNDVMALSADAWRTAARGWRIAVAVVVATAGLVAAGWRWDRPLSERIRASTNPRVQAILGRIRAWGAFNDTLVLAGVLYAAGRWRRRREWRRAALAAVLAGMASGVVVNALRVTTGRPRPRANLPDRFTGPALTWNRQSFPSGHSGASFACAAALLTATPPYGVLATVNAVVVASASVANRSHYLTDAVAGGALGGLVGVAFGVAARRRAAAGAGAPADGGPQ